MQYAVNSGEVWHQLPVSSIAVPQISGHRHLRRVPDSKTAGVKLILQNILNKVVHLIIHSDISSD